MTNLTQLGGTQIALRSTIVIGTFLSRANGDVFELFTCLSSAKVYK